MMTMMRKKKKKENKQGNPNSNPNPIIYQHYRQLLSLHALS